MTSQTKHIREEKERRANRIGLDDYAVNPASRISYYGALVGAGVGAFLFAGWLIAETGEVTSRDYLANFIKYASLTPIFGGLAGASSLTGRLRGFLYDILGDRVIDTTETAVTIEPEREIPTNDRDVPFRTARDETTLAVAGGDFTSEEITSLAYALLVDRAPFSRRGIEKHTKEPHYIYSRISQEKVTIIVNDMAKSGRAKLSERRTELTGKGYDYLIRKLPQEARVVNLVRPEIEV